MNNEEKIYQLALSRIPGIGDITAKTLLSYCGSASAIFHSNNSKLNKIPGIGSFTLGSIRAFNAFDEAADDVKRCEELGVEILFLTDPRYPRRLRQIADAPIVIFHKGNTNLNPVKSVAIVGTRSATSYGRDCVARLIQDLSVHKPLIVSGLAYGIDIYAHRHALENNLQTVGVMGSGLDIIYPTAHKSTARDMCASGGLISEYNLGTKPDAHNFPQRNRIIAALADVIIVVEAAEKGGALITAELANAYNRDVMAVPGDIHKTYSKGCNLLIRNHKASILTGIRDLEYLMNWDPEENGSSARDEKETVLPADLSPEETLVVQTIIENQNEIIIDELSWKTQIQLNKLASILLNLEFKGLIKALPGKKFKLNS
ncbi:MAG: DNA-processing protein DprA [Cyclobacteriaceae bacterium]|nr:DNA-processing protein DprA [Cyclobacteriaceae bacterium]